MSTEKDINSMMDAFGLDDEAKEVIWKAAHELVESMVMEMMYGKADSIRPVGLMRSMEQ